MPAKDNRSLDRVLRTLRATMRTYNLPRPDRLVISTVSRSVHAEFTSGTAVDRVSAVLLWTATLHGVEFGLTLGYRDEVRLAATGRTGSGIGIGLACSGSVVDLGGHVDEHDGFNGRVHRFAQLPGLPTLAEAHTDLASYDELVRLVTAVRVADPHTAEVAA